MDRLHKLIATYFSQNEIRELADELGVYVGEAAPATMALDLFGAASRRLRLDALYTLVNRRRPDLDLRPFLYELIAVSFNQDEMQVLCRDLGVDTPDLGFDPNGLRGWDHDNYIKRTKSRELQDYMYGQEKRAALLDALSRAKPGLGLGAFVAPQAIEPLGKSPAGPVDENGAEKSGPTVIYRIEGDYVVGQKGDTVGADKIGGDKVGGDKIGADKIGGDKVGRDVIKDDIGISTSGGSDAGLSEDASVDFEGQASEEEFSVLIQTIVQEFQGIRSELAEEDAEDAAADLHDIQKMMAQPQLNSGRLARKLANVAAIIAGTRGLADDSSQLSSHLRQAIEMSDAALDD